MYASEIKEGVDFKIEGKRTWHTAKKIIVFDENFSHAPSRGKVLIVTDECKQFIFEPNEVLFTHFKPE